MNDFPKRIGPNAAPGQAAAPPEPEILAPENPAVPRGTEALLDSLIEECRHLVREVALPSMCAATDSLDRMRFMETAVSLVKAGAEVGNTVARLRSGAAGAETRHRVLVERVPSRLAAMDDGEGWGRGDES